MVNIKNYLIITSEEIFDRWLYKRTEVEDGKRYYRHRGKLLKEYELDKQLLQDLNRLFESRVIRNRNYVNAKLNTERATEKQINFANRLYKKLNGEDGNYKEEDYTKAEIGKVIEKLLKEEKAKTIKEPAKVISLSDYF